MDERRPARIGRWMVIAGFGGFMLCAALAIWLGVRHDWSDTLNTGLTFLLIFLYTRLYDWWWEVLPKYLFFLIVGLIAVLVLLILRRLRRQGVPAQ